ncbi:MAG: YjfB family protein [Lachnospiraceae bacterium]|nr:YjfB family protein [Lachnospiraceae bacterium]
MPDIASLSMYMAKNETLQDVGTALLSNALDVQKSMGAATINMMEQSVNPAVGGNIDLRV